MRVRRAATPARGKGQDSEAGLGRPRGSTKDQDEGSDARAAHPAAETVRPRGACRHPAAASVPPPDPGARLPRAPHHLYPKPPRARGAGRGITTVAASRAGCRRARTTKQLWGRSPTRAGPQREGRRRRTSPFALGCQHCGPGRVRRARCGPGQWPGQTRPGQEPVPTEPLRRSGKGRGEGRGERPRRCVPAGPVTVMGAGQGSMQGRSRA